MRRIHNILLPIITITVAVGVANVIGASSAMAGSNHWLPPENLGPSLNSSSRDGCQYLSSDGLTMYVASDRPDGYGGMDLYVAKRHDEDSSWGAPQLLGNGINSEHWEICPALSKDGRVLYFTSERNDGCNDAEITAASGSNPARRDIYMSTRENTNDDFSWSSPVHLGCTASGGFNSDNTDQGPSFYKHGNKVFVYFSSNRSGGKGGHDIYVVQLDHDYRPDLSTLTGVDELNTDQNDHRPYVAKNGLEVYFDSNRDAIPAGDHIYMATRKHKKMPFSQPKLIEAIANGANDINRRATLGNAEGTELYYTANRPGGNGSVDVWVSKRE